MILVEKYTSFTNLVSNSTYARYLYPPSKYICDIILIGEILRWCHYQWLFFVVIGLFVCIVHILQQDC